MYLVEDCANRLIIYDKDKEMLIEMGRGDGRPLPLSSIKVKLDIQESWPRLDENRLSRFLNGERY